MKILQMKQVGRYYYDPNKPANIPQHKLELWPGYITSIQVHEGEELRLKLMNPDAVLGARNCFSIWTLCKYGGC